MSGNIGRLLGGAVPSIEAPALPTAHAHVCARNQFQRSTVNMHRGHDHAYQTPAPKSVVFGATVTSYVQIFERCGRHKGPCLQSARILKKGCASNGATTADVYAPACSIASAGSRMG